MRRRAAWTAAAAGAGLAAWLFRHTRRARPRPAVLEGRPLLIAHRGGGGLAPENTLAALRHGVETWGADMIELDVHASADGRCVVIHDATVDRTTNGSGAVAAMPYAALRELDAGYHFTGDGGATYPFRGSGVYVPTIDDVLESLPGVRMTVELKARAAQVPLFDALDRHDAGARVVIGGMRSRYRTLVAARHAHAVSPSIEQLRPFVLLQRCGVGALWPVTGHVVQVPETWGRVRVVTPAFIRAVHRQGVDVHVWTVNDVADMARLLDWGVDGLVTDRPDLLGMLLYERYGRALAPGHRAA